jgi:hypothetical protein
MGRWWEADRALGEADRALGGKRICRCGEAARALGGGGAGSGYGAERRRIGCWG